MMKKTIQSLAVTMLLVLIGPNSWADDIHKKFEIEEIYKSGQYYIVKFKNFDELWARTYFFGTKTQLRQLEGESRTPRTGSNPFGHGYATTQNVYTFERADAKPKADLILADKTRPAELRCDGKSKKMWPIKDKESFEDEIHAGNVELIALPDITTTKVFNVDDLEAKTWIHTANSHFYAPKQGSTNTYGFRIYMGQYPNLTEKKVVSGSLMRDGGTKVYALEDGTVFTDPFNPKEQTPTKATLVTKDASTTTYAESGVRYDDGRMPHLAWIHGGYEEYQFETPCDFIDKLK